MEASEDKIEHVVDHWLDGIIGGFVTEFAVDTSVSYNKAECCFFKGSRGKYLKLLNTWIKILLCEKRVMQLPLCLGLREVEGLSGTEEEKALNIAH